MIEEIREYIAECPYLDQFTAVNVDYLVDKVKAYSVTEEASYNPVIMTDIVGNKSCEFRFNFDAKFHWNEEIENNISNIEFFDNFKEWLNEKNKNKEYPDIAGITIEKIEATTNGYLYVSGTDEAIYRISCIMKYMKERG